MNRVAGENPCLAIMESHKSLEKANGEKGRVNEVVIAAHRPNVAIVEDDADIGDLLVSVLQRKEVSVAWRDISLPKMIGYGSALYGVEQLAVYPSELLRTRLQIDTRPKVKLWKEMVVLVKHILKKDGIRGFFRGFRFSTMAGIPPQIGYLITYNSCKEYVEGLGGDRWKELGIAPMIGGAMAEGLTAVVWVPLDITVQRLQIQGGLPPSWEQSNSFTQRWAPPANGKERRAIDIIKEMWREDGIVSALTAFCVIDVEKWHQNTANASPRRLNADMRGSPRTSAYAISDPHTRYCRI